MATDVERLVVSLEASITKYERSMQKALGQTNQTAKRIEDRFAKTQAKIGQNFTNVGALIGKALAGAAAVRGAQVLIDANTRIVNSLKVAGLEGEALERVYDSLANSARRNGASFEALSTLYGRAALVQKELGVSAEDLGKFTDNVALALRVAGTDAQSASGALLQLSQALGAGVVRAEEFNSILEGAPTIAQAAAAGITEAGGSVAKLRQLVVEGKVSSDVFFRGFQAGAAILQEKVAGSTFTVSQQFEQLRTVLITTAGKIDDATGASAGAAGALNELATAVERVGAYFERNAARIRPFFQALAAADSFDPVKFREAIGLGVIDDFLEGTSLIEGRFGLASQQIAADAGQIKLAILDSIEAMTGFDSAAALPENLKIKFEGLVDQIEAGKLEAKELQQALKDAGAQPLNFMIAIDGINTLIRKLREARQEAAGLRYDTPAAPGIALQRAEQNGLRPKITPRIATVSVTESLVPPSRTGGGGGGGKSGAQSFEEALAQQRRQNEQLREETALIAALNPLLNDYGLAKAQLAARQELENAAKKAGLEIGPAQREQIEQLSAAYGRATAEAARLAEAQDLARQSADDLAQAGRAALDTIVDGFLEGKDAGEIFNSVLKDLAKSLINMGLNSIGGGMKMGGFNPLGFLGGMFGFASGTANTGGVRGQPRGVVHGQEAVIPLPAGGKVPVDLRLPAIPAVGGGAGGALTVHVVSDDEKFSAYVIDKAGAVVAQASPSIVGASVNQSNKSAPAAVARYQQQRGGSDYRTS